MRRFARFACIDWSGQAVERPRGIAAAMCDAASDAAPVLLQAERGWSRAEVLGWLRDLAAHAEDILVGIDFSPALPFADTGAYFPGWTDSPPGLLALWAMVDRLCADEPFLAASRLPHHPDVGRHYRHRHLGETLVGDLFPAGLGRLRVTERRCRALGLGNAVSSFNLIGAAQVGKSSLTGMRLLNRLRGEKIAFWPVDPLPPAGPVIVEVYTTIAARAAGVAGARTKLRDAAALDLALDRLDSASHRALRGYDDHKTDAILGAAWLRSIAAKQNLWNPPLLTADLAQTEGWTFGVS